MRTDSIRTLLVEDDVDGGSSLEVKLASIRGAPFAVEHRRTLSSAVSRVSAGKLDVVLLDLNLPDSSDVESIARLHEAAPEVPIVVVTETDDEDLALRSLQARAEDYLVKSRADRSVLLRAIRHALERHRVQVDLKQSVRALERSEAKYRNVVASSTDGVAVVSQEGVVLFANSSAARLIGQPVDELQGAMLGYPFAPQARHELTVGDERVVEVHIVESEWDGARVWLVSLFDITYHKRTQAHLEAVTERMQRLNVRLERLASIDPLTEILNRRGLDAELSIELRRKLRRKLRSGAPLAAVLLDCDDFKHINETLGHAGGDAVLKELADRLKQALRPSDHIGRIGGDEFLVLLPETNLAEAFQVAGRLRLSICESPLSMASGPVHITASLGVELVPDDSASIEAVITLTQSSLQCSKRGGKNRVSTQHGAANTSEPYSADLVQVLQTETTFRVLRRPIVRLSDESVIGWEMVSRGPPGVLELPHNLFRVALEYNILTQIDLLCVRACIERAREVRSSVCHINVFPSSLLATPPEQFIELFARRSATRRFCIQLSEQHFIGEATLLREHVSALRIAGIRVAISDVGFGCSSLETLILLEPDIVKIDQDFVRGAAHDVGKERSLRRMVEMVASLGSELVADGVETRDDCQLLRELGVTYAQGSLWGSSGAGGRTDHELRPNFERKSNHTEE